MTDNVAAPEPPEIHDATDRGRYEAHVGETLAGVLEYRVAHERLALVHTEVSPKFEGRGIASALARFALDDARRRGLPVIASCPYIKTYLARHPEDHDIVIGMGAPQDGAGP